MPSVMLGRRLLLLFTLLREKVNLKFSKKVITISYCLNLGSFSNDDGDGGKNEFVFYLQVKQLCKCVQYAYRSKNLSSLNMYRQRSIPKEDTKN